MATCLCDVFFDDVARATVEVLEHLGCAVDVPRDQTCCGQPAFNAGEWAASRRVVRHTLGAFAGEAPVVTPSGSCARMLTHGALLLFEGEADSPGVGQLSRRTWEVADFIVNGLGVGAWGGHLAATIAFHRSCHSRGTRSVDAALALLRSIEGVRVTEVGEAEQCCGFGGTFAVSFPAMSRAIGALKLDHLLAGTPSAVVSGDMGCLMHLDGLARKEGRSVPIRHVVQILRDALPREGRARSPSAAP
jgi:L-lactate dehydrogenase complex protein LldE